MKIGIFGSSGKLGSNMYRYFSEAGYKVFGHDLVASHNSLEETLNADVLFLCLPTPYVKGKLGYDLTAIKAVLKQITDGKIVVLKSTILPGTTDQLQIEYPKLDLLFCPEFLTEVTAWEDTIHPDTSIVGYTDKSYKHTRLILDMLPEAQSEFIMTSKEAEMVKIARNNYFVNKIIFMNSLYDLCVSNGMSYETVKEALSSDRRIRRSHMDIYHQGGRGGGGTCFPKDSSAFRDWAKTFPECRGAYEFIEHYVALNDSLLEKSGKTKGKQWLE